MLKIGLTGGIGSGKSTVAELFAGFGVPIIDTDQLARDLVQPHSHAWEAILKHFGSDVIDASSKQLNRRWLRDKIFSDASEKLWLENLLHHLIREQANLKVEALAADYCILVIPLLLESQYDYKIDRILVVDSHPEQQINRVAERDHVGSEQVLQIMGQQISREERLAKADDIIDNTHPDVAHLKKQVEELHKRYSALAKAN